MRDCGAIFAGLFCLSVLSALPPASARDVLSLRLKWPLCSGMAGPYGWRTDEFTGRMAFHPGIDLAGNYGDIVRAAGPGRVISAEERGPYGLAVETDGGDGTKLRYGHMSTLLVSAGDVVRAGQPIGQVGNTGKAKTMQLHFEVWIGDEVRNPLLYLDRKAGCITPWPDLRNTDRAHPPSAADPGQGNGP